MHQNNVLEKEGLSGRSRVDEKGREKAGELPPMAVELELW